MLLLVDEHHSISRSRSFRWQSGLNAPIATVFTAVGYEKRIVSEMRKKDLFIYFYFLQSMRGVCI